MEIVAIFGYKMQAGERCVVELLGKENGEMGMEIWNISTQIFPWSHFSYFRITKETKERKERRCETCKRPARSATCSSNITLDEARSIYGPRGEYSPASYQTQTALWMMALRK
jgi:hypothetical protein